MQNLTSKVVVITGASRGIGKAIAEVLRSQNYNLVLVSRHISESNTANSLSLQGDITSPPDCQKVITATLKKFGRIDVLINNAGVFLNKPLEKISLPEYQTLMNTNVLGAFLMTQGVIPHMKKQRTGLIVNIGSKISHNTNVSPNKVLYATSKHAIEGFSYSLSKELKPFGIRVTCLMPGTANTFLSLRSRQFLSPARIGEIVSFIIKSPDVDFESIVFKSVRQNI